MDFQYSKDLLLIKEQIDQIETIMDQDVPKGQGQGQSPVSKNNEVAENGSGCQDKNALVSVQ